MNFIEFLGFIISLAAMIFLTSKRFIEDRKRRLNPEEYARREEEQEENLRKFLKSMQMNPDDDEGVVHPPNSKYRKQVQPPQPLIRLREPLKNQPILPKKALSSSSSYGCETANDKKRNQAAAESSYFLHHDLKPAENYEVIRNERPVQGVKLINSLKTPRDLVIIKEIFDKPLSMRDPYI